MLSAVIRSALGYPAFTVGTITGTPGVRPSRSSRTRESPTLGTYYSPRWRRADIEVPNLPVDSSSLLPLHSRANLRLARGNLCTPPLPFGRPTPHRNCLPETVPRPVGPGTRYPFVEGRSSFSWEYGMGYFSAVAPGTRTLARGIFSTPSYPEKAGAPCVLEPITIFRLT
ncbi:hypothetical protein RIF29_48494 [Crotalaria pallida]|uniref:Uncharacterized protein n=1 Tax=Crotalaria pallida TaxID=3830 RepID=A0AAN9DS12_CROPI